MGLITKPNQTKPVGWLVGCLVGWLVGYYMSPSSYMVGSTPFARKTNKSTNHLDRHTPHSSHYFDSHRVAGSGTV